jgi:hypothetical protein
MTCKLVPLTGNLAQGWAVGTVIQEKKHRRACVPADNRARKHSVAIIFLVVSGVLALGGILILALP